MIKKFLSSELGKGAVILFIMINIFNFLNFVFHFSMGRLLGPANYGVLAVLMSLVYILSIPTETIQNIIARYTSKFNLNKENGKIKFLMFKSLKKSFKIAFLVFIPLIFVSLFLSYFLKISFWLFLLTNVIVFAAFSTPVVKGILQGRKKFFLFGWSFIIESVLKLIFAVSLVLIGLKVFGAITGLLLGVFAGLIFSIYFNRDLFKEKEKGTSFKGFYSTSVPYIVSMVVVYLMLSIDIILAKRFFPAEIAGQYAVLSMMGKIVFFGTFSISKAMFPLTSEKHDSNQGSYPLFKRSLLMVAGLSLIAVLIYALFPKLVILILYGSQYVEMAPYLAYSGIALGFLSLSNLVLIYALSINRLRKSYYLFIFLIIEGLLFYLYHNTILEYILAFMVSNIIMFIGSFFFLKKWQSF